MNIKIKAVDYNDDWQILTEWNYLSEREEPRNFTIFPDIQTLQEVCEEFVRLKILSDFDEDTLEILVKNESEVDSEILKFIVSISDNQVESYFVEKI